MSHIQLGPAIPVLGVRHIEDALTFYVNRLGFEVDFRYEKAPDSYAGVKRDDVRLHLRREAPAAFEDGAAGHLRFRIPVNDPDMLFAEFKAMGVFDSDIEVHDTEWGTREFGFHDPDGNRLTFFRIIP